MRKLLLLGLLLIPLHSTAEVPYVIGTPAIDENFAYLTRQLKKNATTVTTLSNATTPDLSAIGVATASLRTDLEALESQQSQSSYIGADKLSLTGGKLTGTLESTSLITTESSITARHTLTANAAEITTYINASSITLNGAYGEGVLPFQRGTGGTITTYSLDGKDYVVHSFNTPGSYTFTPPSGLTTVDVLVVGAGGSGVGGAYGYGGGGGGQVIERYSFPLSTTGAISIFVGSGAVTTDTGEASMFDTIVATGGGKGGGDSGGIPFYASNGASGGGGYYGAPYDPGGIGIYGYDGGYGVGNATQKFGGGGGGAGGLGGTGDPSYINCDNSNYGGPGVPSDILLGTASWYGGGGGGSAGGEGGLGGGAPGMPERNTCHNHTAIAGAPGTGGGGGAGGGVGGSGGVTLRYAINHDPARNAIYANGNIETAYDLTVGSNTYIGQRLYVSSDAFVAGAQFTVGGSTLVVANGKVFIGTTSAAGYLHIQTPVGASSEVDYSLKISSGDSTSVFGIHPNGHISLYGADSTVISSMCANGTMNAMGGDVAGRVTFSGANSVCEVRFGSPYDSTPACVVSGAVAAATEMPTLSSFSPYGFTFIPVTGIWDAGDAVNFICLGMH